MYTTGISVTTTASHLHTKHALFVLLPRIIYRLTATHPLCYCSCRCLIPNVNSIGGRTPCHWYRPVDYGCRVSSRCFYYLCFAKQTGTVHGVGGMHCFILNMVTRISPLLLGFVRYLGPHSLSRDLWGALCKWRHCHILNVTGVYVQNNLHWTVCASPLVS